MIDKSEFIKSIDIPFWKHITKESFFRDIINYRDVNREKFLNELVDDLVSYNYAFKLPYYLYAPKSKGVVRKVKIFNLSDISIYYYCIKQIQDEIISVIKLIPNVFGGFRITKDLKFDESKIEETTYDPAYENALNIYGFRKEWGEYQKLARYLYDKKFKYYIHIDIAHFYDDINLDILERTLRSKINKKQNVIDLLFYFLRNADKRDLGYNPANVGIPQEELGEMSRLLANFYLNSFDVDITSYLNKIFNKNDHIYSRYADDIWISFNGKKDDAQKIIQVCSFYLQKLKLNLNEQKIKILNRKEYYNYWYFKEFDKILRTKRADSILNMFSRLTQTTEKNKGGRWFSPANYAFKVFTGKTKNAKYIKSYKEARSFVDEILGNPKLSYKVNESSYTFLNTLILKYPRLGEYLVRYLYSPKNIYPHTEFFVLQFLIRYYKTKNKIEFFYRFYKKSHFLEYQWYSRVLCLKYFIENVDILRSKHPRKLKPLSDLLKNKSRNMNKLERRYSMFLLKKINNDYSKKVLKENFIQVEDISFKLYIKAA
ncbi:MAG: hypothetical protein KGZ85_15475 [Ignavibacterium sp.]|nr:hypothetical protein [Ignavibacterium sp.]